MQLDYFSNKSGNGRLDDSIQKHQFGTALLISHSIFLAHFYAILSSAVFAHYFLHSLSGCWL
jgi:hypothetical protein